MKVITTNRLNRFWKNGVKPIKDALANKLNTSSIVNNLLTTAAGYALDARQGKALDDKITALNGSLSNKVTSKYSSQINHCHNVKNMIAGQTILNVSTTTTSQVIFTKAQLNSLLGVSNASEVNTVVFVCNNDGSVTTHFDSATYLDSKWYVVANKPWGYTQIRLGYLVIYFG